jgi:16S rRNA (guanine527-N7)-methyltransferase
MSATPREPLKPEQFAQEVGVSRETLQRLQSYLDLLKRWQERINLVGPSTLADPWRRHMLDSAQLASLINGAVLLDMGAGAGFPGMVLAVMRPELDVHLIESDIRKCAFLREVARVTGARPVIHAARTESVSPFPCDVVTARALAPLPELLESSAKFTPRECLFLKGQEAEQELTESTKKWRLQVERIPSRSDPRGVVLRLWEIVRAT